MKRICKVTIPGYCITKGSTAWGENKDYLIEYMNRITAKCQTVREYSEEGHKLACTIKFHLCGRRLESSDLDNMAKGVLDATFSTGNIHADRCQDRLVWRLHLEKLKAKNEKSQKTEIWFFDLDE